MKVLLEASSRAPSDTQIATYNRMTNVQKQDFVEKYLKSLPNSNNTAPNLADYVQYIVSNGWDTPFTSYILALERPLNPKVSKTIQELSTSKVLNPTNLFLKDNSLWKEDTEDTIYKIKVLSMLSNADYKRKYSDIEDFNVNAMKDDKGNFYPADDMRKKLAEWQSQIDAKYGRGSNKKKAEVEFNNEEKRAIDALVTLGKSKSEAEQWVQELNMPNSAAEDIVYRALRLFGDK